MTMKGLSRKHVIIPMSSKNNMKFMKNSSIHIANINRSLRNAKPEVLMDFIWSDLLRIMVVTNKISLQSDLQIIKQYVKNTDDINPLQVEVPWLPQSESYLKIIGISYFPHSNSQNRLTSSNVKEIIKQNQIFDSITLNSRLCVIKVLPKSDMSIIWINIWDVQSGSRAKSLVNWCFSIERYIATIREANMNPRILQCKNCWKWKHTTFSCRIQGSKCVKCNGLHKSENYHEFSWYCKANEKTNPPYLETKWGELCPHIFKYSNCQGDHQVDSTGQSQFILLEMVTHNDLWQLKNLFSECLQKFSNCQHYTRSPVVMILS